jgi:hypothetical membrane protein
MRNNEYRRHAAGVALAVSAVTYLIAEGLAASRFSPSYSYQRDFISELGVPNCEAPAHGVATCSPLSALMNTSFMVDGALFMIATALLFGWLRGRRRYAFGLLSLAHGVGLMLVGMFHAGAADIASGRVAYHLAGASLALFGGNAAIAAAPIGEDVSGSRVVRGSGLILGLVGLLAGAIFVVSVARQTTFWLDNALWERISVYTIVAWELLLGLSLTAASRLSQPHRQPA